MSVAEPAPAGAAVFLAGRIAPNGDGARAADDQDACTALLVAHGSAQGSALISSDY